ncbi:MAG: metalloregulator ArsR/SmtB family transcription factor [Pyrinomonadaceae bacterium]|nr:metalloregulator ArsR/SmtB family transcription factor [Pyrinomonadaceae bacterium]
MISVMVTKNLSNEALELIANRFKILSEPIRLRILQTLQDGERSVTELTEAVETSQPNVSKHLKILQDAGVVKRNQQGNTVYYSIADESIFTLCETVCSSLEMRLRNQAEIFAVNS